MKKQIKNRKKIVLLVSLLFLSIIFSLVNFVSAGSFSRSFVGYSPYTEVKGSFGDVSFPFDSYGNFDRSLCEAGQDFILYVSPLGCTPPVVRSDLLEEQNSPVFCPITATQLNPLISVEAIDRMSFEGEVPAEVSGVGYYPARAALGKAGFQLNQPIMNEIGYAVIVLKQQKNESAMPDFVEGNLTARISYDIKNAFGLGQATFYLPQMNDEEWNQNFKEYSFWQGRGYLRAESIDYDGAVISIYSGRETYSTATTDKRVLTKETLGAGETSREILMPGFDYCMGGLQLKLEGLENPDTTVRLNINGDYLELQEGERFIENKCQVMPKSIEKRGIVQQATIRCRDDIKGNVNLPLRINPKIILSIGGVNSSYSAGDKLFETKNGEKSVYLVYVTTKGETKMQEDLTIALVEMPGVKEKLSDEELSDFSGFFNRAPKGDISVVDVLRASLTSFETAGKWVVSGESFRIISYPDKIKDIFGNLQKDISGKEVKIVGFADATDVKLSEIFGQEESSSELKEYYEKAVSDYDDVIESHVGETYPPEIKREPLDQQALYEKIDLVWKANQKETAIKLCKEYEEKYPDFAPPSVCNQAYKYSSSDIDSESVEINGRVYSIMIDGVKEPTFDDFGAVISVRTPEGNTIFYDLRKEDLIYLGTGYSYDAGNSSPIYYKYSDESWQWSPDKTYWMSVDTTKVSGGEFNGREPVQKQKEIINYLNKNKSSLQDGEIYLLEIGAKIEKIGAFIQLLDVDKNPSGEDSVKIGTNMREGVVEGVKRLMIGEAITITLKEGFPDSRAGYVFSLQQVNLQKVAKVSVVADINRQETEATFPFKIGIEKRAIQLSPEKTEERIEKLNKTVEQWRNINDKLGSVVRAGKAACFATGTALVVKNFFANLGGEGTARQIVMRGSGGWFDQCEKMVNTGEFVGTVDECLSEPEHNKEIEDAVDETASEIERINKIFSEEIPECQGTGGFLGEKVVNTDACLEKYLEKQKPSIEGNIQQAGLTNVFVEGKKVPISSILGNVTFDNIIITQARDIELYSSLLNSEDQRTREIAEAQLNNIFSDVWINSREGVERSIFADKYGAGNAATIISLGRGLQPIPATEITTLGKLNIKTDIAKNTPAYLVHDRDEKIDYLLILDDTNAIRETYRINADRTITRMKTEENELNPLGLTIKKFDANTYKNKCPNCEVRYYQTGAYEGLPAIVPFDVEDGWYAAIKPVLPLGGGQALQPYDDSGRVTNFYLCNVGSDGREDFFRLINFGGVDDVCRLVNLGTGQSYDQFPGISSAEARQKINDAQVAFRAASSAYRSEIKKGDFVNIMGKKIKVGEAAVGTPEIQCQDFMSPSECNILFNICDPFICPSSRCDLGGTYPVDNVIQSGVIGSVVLCLPNFPEVKVPVCLSGVYAGIDGYLNILEEYQECLQTSLDTGQQVGVCDTLHSIYICDFFWRQSLPAVKYALPEVISSLLGKNVRGGGEYLSVQDSFDRASDSVNFFTQYYAADSFKAFQARSIEGVGTEVCRNWLSVPGMDAGKLFDALIAPDSPSQFLGWFDEIPYTTAKEPPISHYKVFYHIYAGQDFTAQYEVYLRGDSTTLTLGASERRLVGKGFIEAGERVQETEDFTAPSGYKKMCILVNNQEECGFKQVSTDFAVQYLSDKFAADEASRTDITTEQSCISGNPNILSLVSPNIQAGVEEIANPEIYNRGITRVCSTDNPGLSTDPNAATENARWQEVGYCDTPNIKCWLDTKSVKDAVEITTIEEEALGEVEENWLNVLKEDMDLIENFDEFVGELENMKNEGKYKEVITKINENFDRVFFSYEKGYLTLIRANAFSTLAKGIFNDNIVGGETDTNEKEHTNKSTDSDEKETEESSVKVRSCKECSRLGIKFLGCTQSSCEEIDAERKKQGLTGCEFIPGEGLFKTNQCIQKSLECSTTKECQKVLGNEIIKIAREIKQERGISDMSVKEDTGVKNFECLVLMVAMTESTIQYCSPIQQDGNPLYCDSTKEGESDGLLKGDDFRSIGVMQINIDAHSDAFPESYHFEGNVEYGANLLTDYYNSFKDGKKFFPTDTFYKGWAAALRAYNGWGPGGNNRYVEDVLGTSRDKVVQLFPDVCGS